MFYRHKILKRPTKPNYFYAVVMWIKFTQHGLSGEPEDNSIEVKQKPKNHSPLKLELT